MKLFLYINTVALLASSCSETHSVTYHSPINYSRNFIGWDCPDNLAFPKIALKDWQKVPVVNGRLPTYEETKDGSSLLYVDKELNPELKDVKPYNMTLPRLAYFINPRNNEKEVVIIIQLVQFSDYVWAGIRYVNGGNASTMMDNLDFLTDEQVKKEIEKSEQPKPIGEINKL